jgi:1,4-dihydroxy-2-naphthoate octaprenyltransferase
VTTLGLWVKGARPRTLGAAVAPVLVGTSAASRYLLDISFLHAFLALVVALGLQIGVNYANDYSDGVRGVDAERRGPLRLTASGSVPPGAVKAAAFLSLAVAAAAGIWLALLVDPWLIAVGAVAVLAAWFYSGGPKPYGAAGLGEVMVLIFFGFVATCGSAYVQLERVPLLAVGAAAPVGLLACAILVVNNLRDVETDRASGKRTLAVRIGAPAARALYKACVAGSFLALAPLAFVAPGALIALAAMPLAIDPLRTVHPGAEPAVLVEGLIATARLQLVFSILLAIGLWL